MSSFLNIYKIELSQLAQTGATLGQILEWNGIQWAPATPAPTGVTSVGLSLPSIFSVSGSPVTGAGTLTAAYVSTQLIAPSDGLLQITNAAGADFNRLQLGGTTSSFPALQRNGAGLRARLADDSANTTVEASEFLGFNDSTAYFGTGADGSVTFDGVTPVLGYTPSSGVYVITRDLMLNDCTINGTANVSMGSFRLYVKGTLDLSAAPEGAIQFRAPSLLNGGAASGTTGGTQPAAVLTVSWLGTGTRGAAGVNGGTAAGTAGAAGVGSAAGLSSTSGLSSGAGGAGSSGGGGAVGASGASTNYATPFRRQPVIGDWAGEVARTVFLTGGPSGGSGGSGGGDGVAGGGSGAGGSGGGIVFVCARTIARGSNTNTSIIRSRGGDGGNGGSPAGGDRGGGGGGSGGHGGGIRIVCYNRTGSAIPNAIDVRGGDGGTGGNGTGTGVGGGGGAANPSGTGMLYEISTGTYVQNNTAGGASGSAAVGGAGGAGGVANTNGRFAL